MSIHYVVLFYSLSFYLHIPQRCTKPLLYAHHCVKNYEALNRSDMWSALMELLFYQNQTLNKRLWCSKVQDDSGGSHPVWDYRLPGRNDIHTEKMKGEREIAKQRGCWEGLKDTSQTDRLA